MVSEYHDVDIYFAKPHTSWQRETNEITNDRLRRQWPKKFDIATLIEKEIKDEVFLLNMTPRIVLNGLTPLEIRVALMA